MNYWKALEKVEPIQGDPAADSLIENMLSAARDLDRCNPDDRDAFRIAVERYSENERQLLNYINQSYFDSNRM